MGWWPRESHARRGIRPGHTTQEVPMVSAFKENAGIVYRYWILRLRELTHHEEYSSTFNRWERQIQECDPSFTLPDKTNVMMIHDIRKQLNQAKKTLRKIQKTATQSRVVCYEELVACWLWSWHKPGYEAWIAKTCENCLQDNKDRGNQKYV